MKKKGTNKYSKQISLTDYFIGWFHVCCYFFVLEDLYIPSYPSIDNCNFQFNFFVSFKLQQLKKLKIKIKLLN